MKVRFNPRIETVLAIIKARISEQEAIVVSETDLSDELSPVIASNAARYISQLTDWGKLIESCDDDPDKIGQVWVEIDL
jgi:hypothetical protein